MFLDKVQGSGFGFGVCSAILGLRILGYRIWGLGWRLGMAFLSCDC